nr:hypothetical protein [Tanacetum cinerariifolium]
MFKKLHFNINLADAFDLMPNTTYPSDSFSTLIPFNTSDSFLDKFADELTLLEPFPPGNEDDNFDPEADLREIEYLLNRDPSTDSSPTTDTDVINPILERFIDEPALVYSSSPGDDGDDLFDFKSDNEEWKKLLYGGLFDNTHSENEDKDLKMECLIDDMDDDFFPLLPTSDSTILRSHLSHLRCYLNKASFFELVVELFRMK